MPIFGIEDSVFSCPNDLGFSGYWTRKVKFAIGVSGLTYLALELVEPKIGQPFGGVSDGEYAR